MRFRNRNAKTERALRRLRAEPPRDLVDRIVGSIEPARSGGASGRLRVAFAGALTLVLLVALASVGGMGYAASAATSAVHVVKKAFSPLSKDSAISVRGISAGGDQYRPGFGYGDPNHNHTGPPGLKRAGGSAFAPIVQAKNAKGKAKVVKFSLNVDEQAHLWISVLDAKGKRVLLTQSSKKGSTTFGGRKLHGRQAKTLQYLVLVPRNIPISLRIPQNLLKPGQTYRIRVIARDPQRHRSVFILPFKA